MPLAALIPMLAPVIGSLLGGLFGGGGAAAAGAAGAGAAGAGAGGLEGILGSLMGGLGGGGGGTPNILSLLGGLGGGGKAGAGGGGLDIGSLVGGLLGGGAKGGTSPVDAANAMQLAAGGKPLTEQQLALTLAGQPVKLPDYAQVGLESLKNSANQQALKQYVSMAGRAVVNRNAMALQPELKAAYDLLKQHGLQIQATAEHRNIQRGDDRYRLVMDELKNIRAQLDLIKRAMPAGGAARF